MGESRENRKIKYTKMVLRESLLTLMRKKPISRISVSELCVLADINRGTFYQHYEDVYDLLDSIENVFYEQTLASACEGYSVEMILERELTAVSENRDLCEVIFGEFGDKEFLRKCCSVGRDLIYEQWKQAGQLADAQFEYIYSFAVDGMVGIIGQWINSGLKETPAELAVISTQLLYRGINGLLKLQ